MLSSFSVPVAVPMNFRRLFGFPGLQLYQTSKNLLIPFSRILVHQICSWINRRVIDRSSHIYFFSANEVWGVGRRHASLIRSAMCLYWYAACERDPETPYHTSFRKASNPSENVWVNTAKVLKSACVKIMPHDASAVLTECLRFCANITLKLFVI